MWIPGRIGKVVLSQAPPYSEATYSPVIDNLEFGSAAATSATPESATLTLLGIGIASMAGYSWKRRKQKVATICKSSRGSKSNLKGQGVLPWPFHFSKFHPLFRPLLVWCPPNVARRGGQGLPSAGCAGGLGGGPIPHVDLRAGSGLRPHVDGQASGAAEGLPGQSAAHAGQAQQTAAAARSEREERTFAHVCETGGGRRGCLQGLAQVSKRYLMQVAAHNLGIVMRKLFRVGTPRSLQGAAAALARAISVSSLRWCFQKVS